MVKGFGSVADDVRVVSFGNFFNVCKAVVDLADKVGLGGSRGDAFGRCCFTEFSSYVGSKCQEFFHGYDN